MAKQALKSGGTSRIRFVMVDAEIAEGDVGSITQAIQNALRGPAPAQIQRLTAAPKPAAVEVNGGHEPDTEVDVDESEDVIEAAPARSRAPRKPAPKPSVIELDITSEPPLASLIDPKSNHKRYLAIAAWLHDHRGIEAVTADHIYTCYRHLGWPIDILDFAQPLRELKHKQYFTTPERGKYAINQLGLAKAAEAAE
jgi:hypothetical protein